MSIFPIFAQNLLTKPMKLLFLTLFLLAVAFLLLGVKVLFVKGGKFPSGHVHDIEALRHRRGTEQAQNKDKQTATK